MRIGEALSQSSFEMAEGRTARGQSVIARRHGPEVRVIKSYTDPTVVRKLTRFEFLSDAWQPIDDRREQP